VLPVSAAAGAESSAITMSGMQPMSMAAIINNAAILLFIPSVRFALLLYAL
jgi:hypothetical protein